ncbi:MAG TPA: DUF1573 domain-containing protein [Crocinitomix sp.]|nr:DUF1573 domain-containing protein [Crocinitomix sp.]
MKKVILNLTLVVVALLGVNMSVMAQDNGGAAVVTDGPQIKVDKDVHDYGTIEQGGDGTCTFTITNTGNQPLIISMCKGSCGCTVPTCPKEPIAPGASATITVKYDTKRVGPINKSVTITSNASNEPRKIVRIKGTVKAKPTGSAPVNTGTPTNP